MPEVICHNCKAVNVQEFFGRSDECDKCGSDLRVCLNCRFYDVNAHHMCQENQAEWVKEKSAGNFCDYFRPRAKASKNQEDSNERKALDKLFGIDPDQKPKQLTLKDLFKDS